MIKFHTLANLPKMKISENPSMQHYNPVTMQELFTIQNVANQINSRAQIFLVIGVGGSFLGARAVIDALTP